jgi:hypothetical protein
MSAASLAPKMEADCACQPEPGLLAMGACLSIR